MIEMLTSSSKAQPMMFLWFSRWRCFQYHSSSLRDFIGNLRRKYFLTPEFVIQNMLYLLWQEKCQWPFLKYTLPYPVILHWLKFGLLKKQANVLLNIEIHIRNIPSSQNFFFRSWNILHFQLNVCKDWSLVPQPTCCLNWVWEGWRKWLFPSQMGTLSAVGMTQMTA